MDSRCPVCGATVAAGSKFCPVCGASLEKKQADRPAQLFCGHCGKALDESVQFCPYCGQLVRSGGQQTAPPGNGQTAGKTVSDGFIPTGETDGAVWKLCWNYKGRIDRKTYLIQMLICYAIIMSLTIFFDVLLEYPLIMKLTAAGIAFLLAWGCKRLKDPLLKRLGGITSIIMLIAIFWHRGHIIQRPSFDIVGIAVVVVLIIVSLVIVAYKIILDIRRCHDLNYTGWLALLGLIPIVEFIFAIYLACFTGVKGPNEYGADPLQQKNGIS